MSYTILHTVPASGPIQTYREFHNSHLWARVYWDWLGKTYLNMTDGEFFISSNYKKIWALFKDERIPVEQRIALGATFDWVMVKREDIHRLVPAFERVANISNNDRWSEMAKSLEKYLTEDRDDVAICWTVTSITDPWHVPDIINGHDDVRMYDISKDRKHWFLFNDLQK